LIFERILHRVSSKQNFYAGYGSTVAPDLQHCHSLRTGRFDNVKGLPK
jgi:hypothetical protein